MKIEFDPKKLGVVPIGAVRPNPWNPKEEGTDEYSRIVKGIREKGLRMPIPVREVDGGYEIIDGQQRWTACREIGFKSIPIYNEGKVSDQEAKELTIWYQQQVPFEEVALAKLVAELAMAPGFSLPYTMDEIEEMKNFVAFDWNTFGMAEVDFEEKGPEAKHEYRVNPDQFSRIEAIATEGDSTGEGIQVRIMVVRKIFMTPAQKNIVDMAIRTAKTSLNCSEGRALELICADYLAGAGGVTSE
jgi:hypothetical protein